MRLKDRTNLTLTSYESAATPECRPGIWPKPSISQGTLGTPYACESIRILKPGVINRDDLEALIGGDVMASTLAHIATYFGVGLQTVKNWRQMGMPILKSKYSVLDVLAWRLEEDAAGERRDVLVTGCSRCDAHRLRKRQSKPRLSEDVNGDVQS